MRHGIADRPEGGHIELRATTDGARLVLRVTDDGRGGTPGAGDGLGLGSVRRRLTALYGHRATLSIDNTATGFTVTIGLSATDNLGSAA